MIELCGARVLDGHDRRRRRAPAGGRDHPARGARAGRSSASRSTRERQAADPAGARLHHRARRRRSRCHRARAAPRRRHARDRPDRGGRADRRARAAAGDAAGAPRRRRASHARPARAPRRRGRAGGARAVRDRRLELHRARAARSPAARPEHDMRAWSRSRTRCRRPVDHAPDAARLAAGRRPPQRLAATAPTSRSSSRAPSTASPLPSCPSWPGWPTNTTPSGCCSAARWRRARGARGACRRTSSPPRRCWRRCSSASALAWSVAPAQWPFLHPGRSAAVRARRRQRAGAARLHRRAAPAGGGRVGPRAHRRVRARPRHARRRGRPRSHRSRRSRAYPALRQDIAVTLPQTVAVAEVLERVRAHGGGSLEDVEVFDVYSGEQVGEGRRSLALALSFRTLERTLTDEDIAPRARADRGGARRARR